MCTANSPCNSPQHSGGMRSGLCLEDHTNINVGEDTELDSEFLMTTMNHVSLSVLSDGAVTVCLPALISGVVTD